MGMNPYSEGSYSVGVSNSHTIWPLEPSECLLLICRVSQYNEADAEFSYVMCSLGDICFVGEELVIFERN